jgi:hypothetical protein
VAFPVAAGQADGAISGVRALGVRGLSVTMPHKADVIPFLDRLTATAQALGAVNCVFRDRDDDQVLVGDNTDGAGFLGGLRTDFGLDPAGRRCVVLGAGGAARAVVLALAEAGAAAVPNGRSGQRPWPVRSVRSPGRTPSAAQIWWSTRPLSGWVTTNGSRSRQSCWVRTRSWPNSSTTPHGRP